MKGHVPTPAAVVDHMVARLFSQREPRSSDVVIDPGCGDGPFIEGVLRHCRQRGLTPPPIIGVETDPRHLSRAQARFAHEPAVTLLQQDYLDNPLGPADFIIGNPPYVGITGLDEREKARYKRTFETAVGRFDLYLLFFERSLQNLAPGGRLVFITPEKFEYVGTAAPLRKLLASQRMESLEHVAEDTFPGLVTYPTITTVQREPSTPESRTLVRFRDGLEREVALPADGASWNAALAGGLEADDGIPTLQDVCIRISCGIATGADEIFTQPDDARLPRGLRPFAHPTVSGRQLGLSGITDDTSVVATRDVMLIPYDDSGNLLPEHRLGDLATHLRRPDNLRKLQERPRVREGGKTWYRFYDNVPFADLRRPKILFKDITPEPRFWADRTGAIVPRHSVYYAVPKPGVDRDALLAYLNGPEAREWLRARCQRAANGFFRLQSSVVRTLPVPPSLARMGHRKERAAATRQSRLGEA